MLTQERLKELLEYDEDDGEFYWKVHYTNVSAFDLAGSLNGKRYREIMIDGKAYGAHRLVFLYTDGAFPKQTVDHIDGNPSNNKRDNLRLATRSQNAVNRPAGKNNKLGIKNVYERNGKYMVQLRVDYKLVHFGTFEDLELAELVATEARNKYHGAYARHL